MSRRVGRIHGGALLALGVLVGCTILAMPAALSVPKPSDVLLGDVASVGTGLLLAYVVEISWLTGRVRRAPDYEKRLGVFVGIGAGGLIGVLVALLLAAHRAAGHSNLLDGIGLAWVAVSLAMLGGIVIAQPLLVHEWSDEQANSD